MGIPFPEMPPEIVHSGSNLSVISTMCTHPILIKMWYEEYQRFLPSEFDINSVEQIWNDDENRL